MACAVSAGFVVVILRKKDIDCCKDALRPCNNVGLNP